MQQADTLQQKVRHLLIIMLPILVTQLATFAMSFFDSIMSGQASAADLAGVALGTSIWVPLQTGLAGILFAITPIVAQRVGAGRKDLVSHTVIQGGYLGLAVSIFVILLGAVLLDPVLNAMSLEEEVRRTARGYLLAIAWGIPPFFVHTVLRCFIDALGLTRISMIITLLSLPVNVVLNYILIFGKLGFPALGGIGAGIATAVTYWIIAIIACFIVIRNSPFASFSLFSKLHKVSWKEWRELLVTGVPIGFAIFFETGIFAAVTLLMSGFDTTTIAAHQTAINFSTFLYMFPLSIAMALTIVVGFEVGAGRFSHAKQYGKLGIAAALLMAGINAFILYVWADPIAALYTKDEAVRQLAKAFMLYAVFFQLSDAFATPIQGILRGYKDVNAAFVITLICFWFIGLPFGFALSRYTELGAFGYWIGLITGLAIGAVCLYARLAQVQRAARQNQFIPS